MFWGTLSRTPRTGDVRPRTGDDRLQLSRSGRWFDRILWLWRVAVAVAWPWGCPGPYSRRSGPLAATWSGFSAPWLTSPVRGGRPATSPVQHWRQKIDLSKPMELAGDTLISDSPVPGGHPGAIPVSGDQFWSQKNFPNWRSFIGCWHCSSEILETE